MRRCYVPFTWVAGFTESKSPNPQRGQGAESWASRAEAPLLSALVSRDGGWEKPPGWKTGWPQGPALCGAGGSLKHLVLLVSPSVQQLCSKGHVEVLPLLRLLQLLYFQWMHPGHVSVCNEQLVWDQRPASVNIQFRILYGQKQKQKLHFRQETSCLKNFVGPALIMDTGVMFWDPLTSFKPDQEEEKIKGRMERVDLPSSER